MIVVKVEMWPGGSEKGKYELCTMTMTNTPKPGETRSADPAVGDYEIKLFRRPNVHGHSADIRKWKPIRFGTVKRHRRRDYHVMVLVRKALTSLGMDKYIG